MVLGVTAAALALAKPVFGPPQTVATVPSVGYLSEIGLADVTGDGVADIVAVREDDSDPSATFPVVILAGNGRGSFTDVSSQVFVGPPARTQHARQIVFADFNRDGRTDFFVADHGYDHPPFPGHQNTLVLSAPGGKLVDATANLPQRSDFTHSAAAADVNGDGAADICAGNLTSPGAELLLNDGTGHFTVAPNALPFLGGGASFTRETFADVDGDGDQDLVLLSMRDHDGITTGPSRVLLNDGRGHFTDLPGAMPPKPFGGPSEGLAVAAADLNGDGKVDLLAGYSGTGGPGDPLYVGRYVQVLIGNGDGTFRDETPTRLPQTLDRTVDWPFAIRIADLNRDGKPDVVVSLSEEHPTEAPLAYINRGDGTFTALLFSAPPFAMVDVADVNGDGSADLVSASAGFRSSDTYAASLQQVATPTPTPKRVPLCKRGQHSTTRHPCRRHR